MIARLKPSPPSDALRGRTHAVELIGYSQIQSRGVKAGAVVDLAECEQTVRQAVALAERMAKVRVESVLLSVSGGRLQGAPGRGRGRHSRRLGHARGRHPGDIHRHAPCHRRGPHRAACAPGRLRARWREGHPRSPRHGRAAVRRRHERGDGGCHRGPQSDAGGRALPSQCRGDGGESLCRRPFGADRRRGRSRRRRGRNGRRIDHDCDVFGRTLRSRERICTRRASRHDGSCTRRRRMHCGCRANQDFIRHRADRRVRRARADVCSFRRRGTRCAADRLARHDREHRPASRRGDF